MNELDARAAESVPTQGCPCTTNVPCEDMRALAHAAVRVARRSAPRSLRGAYARAQWEDAIQATIAHLVGKHRAGTLRPVDNWEAYVMTSTLRRVITSLANGAREASRLRKREVVVARTPEEQLAQQQLLRNADVAWKNARASAGDRAAFERTTLHDVPAPEAAVELGKPSGTSVRTASYRANEALRDAWYELTGELV